MSSSTFLNLPAEKQEKLLEAATREFSHKPFNEASINQIIKEAGIPRGSFYMYFQDKEDLFRYLLKGYVLNPYNSHIESRLHEHDRQIEYLTDKVDFFVRTSLPPVEGIFYDGQVFDAYKFASDLVRSAKESILLIDNYVDESVLMMLSKRQEGVTVTIYTRKIGEQLCLDIERHNAQYPPVEVCTCDRVHDRFLIIDGADVYHIGASLKDLGKRMFAFSRLNISPSVITADL